VNDMKEKKRRKRRRKKRIREKGKRKTEKRGHARKSRLGLVNVTGHCGCPRCTQVFRREK